MAILYRLFAFALAALIFGGAFSCSAATADSLLTEVVSLQLGLNGYVIGRQLDGAQKKVAANNPLQGAYEGTFKFVDDDLNIVADSKTDRVLALYKQKKDADKNQLKAMVADLMGRFGEPTTMAHDKILYWAFNKHGAVSEDEFINAKKVQQTTELEIVATVKLNSEMAIFPDPQIVEGETKKDDPALGTIYFIITSDPLLRGFIESHPQ